MYAHIHISLFLYIVVSSYVFFSLLFVCVVVLVITLITLIGTIMANQKNVQKNTFTLRASLIRHLFLHVIPIPLAEGHPEYVSYLITLITLIIIIMYVMYVCGGVGRIETFGRTKAVVSRPSWCWWGFYIWCPDTTLWRVSPCVTPGHIALITLITLLVLSITESDRPYIHCC